MRDAVDFAALRAGRLARLQAEMSRLDLPACLFFNPANIRYATGTSVMAVYTANTFVRCALVPAAGEPILFEHTTSVHLSRRIVRDVRPMNAWAFGGGKAFDQARRWSREIRSALRTLGAPGDRLAVDRLDATGFLALQREGFTLLDSGEATCEARRIKTPEEIRLLRINGRIGEAMLAAFEAAIRPGVREIDLLALLTRTLIERGGEHLITRACVAGPNTNPFCLEAGERPVETGDLVLVDTDAIGYEGYLMDVSRTFLCGDRPTDAQKDAYRAAHDCVRGMIDLVRPGIAIEEFVRRAPQLPERYREQRYEQMYHEAGLEDEGPILPYPDDDATPMPPGRIEEGMVLCLECYAGETGAPFAVKLEDQVLVTANGSELLCRYPYDRRLLD